MRSTPLSLGGPLHRTEQDPVLLTPRTLGAGLGTGPAWAAAGGRPIRCPFVVLELLMVAGVLLLAIPALVRGARGLRRRSRYYGRAVGADRVALVLVVAIQLLTLLLVAVLSLVVLVCAVGAIVRDLEMPGLVSVFFLLDLLLAALVVLTFGRPARRRVRRRATPAAR